MLDLEGALHHYPGRGVGPCSAPCAPLRSGLCVCVLANSMEAAAVEGEVPAEVPRALFAHAGAALGGRGGGGTGGSGRG